MADLTSRPSVGRAVHYLSYGTPGGEFKSVCRAATITEVGGWITISGDDPDEVWEENDGVLNREIMQVYDTTACVLKVDNPIGIFFNLCQQDEGSATVPGFPRQPGTWHWPERVD